MSEKNMFLTIAKLDLTEAKKQTFENICKAIDKEIDSIESICKDIKYLKVVKSNIEDYGLTESICDTYEDGVWHKFNFDIRPFVNSSNEQLACCTEALTTVLVKLYDALIAIIDKLINFFKYDSIFYRYFNRCTMQRKQIRDLKTVLDKAVVNKTVFNTELATVFNYNDFRNRRAAISSIMKEINSFPTQEQQVIDYDVYSIKSRCQQNFEALNGTLEIVNNTPSIRYNDENSLYSQQLATLLWTPERVLSEAYLMINTLDTGVSVNRMINTLQRLLKAVRTRLESVKHGTMEGNLEQDTKLCNTIKGYRDICKFTYDKLCGLGSMMVTLMNIQKRCTGAVNTNANEMLPINVSDDPDASQESIEMALISIGSGIAGALIGYIGNGKGKNGFDNYVHLNKLIEEKSWEFDQEKFDNKLASHRLLKYEYVKQTLNKINECIDLIDKLPRAEDFYKSQVNATLNKLAKNLGFEEIKETDTQADVTKRSNKISNTIGNVGFFIVLGITIGAIFAPETLIATLIATVGSASVGLISALASRFGVHLNETKANQIANNTASSLGYTPSNLKELIGLAIKTYQKFYSVIDGKLSGYDWIIADDDEKGYYYIDEEKIDETDENITKINMNIKRLMKYTEVVTNTIRTANSLIDNVARLTKK